MEFAITARARADNSYPLCVGDCLARKTALYLCRRRARRLRPLPAQQLRREAGLHAFPYGTLLINVTGSLLLGFFLILATERLFIADHWRLLVAVGFCGSYTTFSSYAFESFALMEQGQWLQAAMNVVGSNLLCLARSGRRRLCEVDIEWHRDGSSGNHVSLRRRLVAPPPAAFGGAEVSARRTSCGAVAFHSVAGFQGRNRVRRPTWWRPGRSSRCRPFVDTTSMSIACFPSCARWRRIGSSFVRMW